MITIILVHVLCSGHCTPLGCHDVREDGREVPHYYQLYTSRVYIFMSISN